MKIKPLINKFLPILNRWGAGGNGALNLAEELAQSLNDFQEKGTIQKKSKIAVLRRTAGLDKSDKPTKNYYVYIQCNLNKDKEAIKELMALGLLMTSSAESDGRLVVYSLTDTGCDALGFSNLAVLEKYYNQGRW